MHLPVRQIASQLACMKLVTLQEAAEELHLPGSPTESPSALYYSLRKPVLVNLHGEENGIGLCLPRTSSKCPQIIDGMVK